jgi:hypothetical protein
VSSASAKVATEEERFDAFEERRVGRHHVDELAVLRAGLAHDDLTVLFQNLRFDFARMLIHQRLERVSPEMTASRTSLTQRGQRLSVSRGKPSGGALRS